MRLLELSIRLKDYGTDKGKYTGHAKFGNKKGKVDLRLSAEHCEKIFQVCADGIVDTAKQAAEELTVSVIEHQKTIEAS